MGSWTDVVNCARASEEEVYTLSVQFNEAMNDILPEPKVRRIGSCTTVHYFGATYVPAY